MAGSNRGVDILAGMVLGVAASAIAFVVARSGGAASSGNDAYGSLQKSRRRVKGRQIPADAKADPIPELLGKAAAGPLGGPEVECVWRCSVPTLSKDFTVQQTRRWVCCCDAVTWLRAQPSIPACVVTSLPDISELERDHIKTVEAYNAWFIEAATLILNKVRPKDVVIFYQTDTKLEGRNIAKAGLCYVAAQAAGSACLWHKIAWSSAPGTVRFGRPSYTHVVAFSKEFRDANDGKLPKSPDVLDKGSTIWARGIGLDACRLACQYVAAAGAECIVDPFCGYGSVLAVANQLGIEAVGLERSPKRCKFATLLTSSEDWSSLKGRVVSEA